MFHVEHSNFSLGNIRSALESQQNALGFYWACSGLVLPFYA